MVPRKEEYVITEGPSKWDLMLSLFDSTGSCPRKINFSGYPREDKERKTENFSVLVSAIQKEDGSGESWNIDAFHDKRKVRVYFSTRNRTGHLKFV